MATVSSSHYTYSIFAYGPSHIICLGRQQTTDFVSAVVYDRTSTSLIFRAEYMISPSPGTYLYSYIYDWSTQYIHIDFPNQKVIFSIYSDGAEPFRNGFYYLHVRANSPFSVCMTRLPLNNCNLPLPASQVIPLTGTVYKHYNEPGSWPTIFS